MIELKIYNIDCLVGMQDIDDKSIDMICCDLPYGVGNEHPTHTQIKVMLSLIIAWAVGLQPLHV